MRQRAAIRLSEAMAGDFPPVCVVTGEAATGTRTKALAATTRGSDWAWPIFIVFGLVIFVLARFWSAKAIDIDLPVRDETVRLWRIGGHIDGEWLWLSGVHANFARELGRRYADLEKDERPRA